MISNLIVESTEVAFGDAGAKLLVGKSRVVVAAKTRARAVLRTCVAWVGAESCDKQTLGRLVYQIRETINGVVRCNLKTVGRLVRERC